MDIPRRSGLLTQRELRITENWDVRGLLAQMREGTFSAEDVVRAFSKVGCPGEPGGRYTFVYAHGISERPLLTKLHAV
jgi:hypothetical protein